MRILHTSDWHLGMPLKLGTMIADQQYFLEQLYSIIEEYDVDAVICAGDIYDSSVTNAEAIELYSSAITKICKELGKKMIVIAGNHDSGARLASGRELLEMAGLYVSGKIVNSFWWRKVPPGFEPCHWSVDCCAGTERRYKTGRHVHR